MKTIDELKELLAAAQTNIDAFKRTTSLLAQHNPQGYSEQLTQLQRDYSVIAGQLNQALYDARIQAHKDAAHATGEANRAKIADERAVKEAQDKLDRQAQMRAQALNTWLEGGGSVESFDHNWEGIKIELLKAQTIAAITAPPPPDAYTRWKQRQAGRVVAQ